MPTYAYRCTECGYAFDAVQAFTDDALTVCPNCGGKLRKVFSPVGVTFNGSGFYRTDSRKGTGPSGSGGGGSESSGTSGDSSAATGGSSGGSSGTTGSSSDASSGSSSGSSGAATGS